MNQATKDRLSKIPKKRCFKCNTVRSYGNPMARCHECRQSFCFDHISCLQVNDTMGQNEAVKNVCEVCIGKYGYRSI